MTKTARYVAELARREGIQYLATFADEWATAVTGLLGDDVAPDATDNLLVALARAGKLSLRDMVALTIAHHRELKQHV
ncbi:hypothetical protein CTP10_R52840 [Cupriavidus sp. P-10]|uniref:hypothetical protein n=1 Tax=Cupriavidus sp. P-10 TaxID=2027911 RepID=UPI000E2EBB3C|nr:hypothetical protein [Cupriavidus sp. P-10]BDB27874.1 hypothetical protein CTP10_R52840 [Cupriavidus sp. P-10]